MGSGKDTFAEYAASKYQYNIGSFAYALKEAAMEAFKLTEEEVYDRKLKEVPHQYWGISPRRILQLMGTEAMRGTFGENIWIKRLELELYQSDRPTFIVDVRFQNEVNYIKEKGVIIHIIRENNPFINPINSSHSSEADAILPSEGVFEISNSSTKSHFYSQIQNLMDSIIAQYKLPRF